MAFSAEVKLLDWDIPASVVAQKGDLYIDVWLSAGMHGEDFRFYILLDDREGNEHIASLPPGYDWYTPAEWEAEEAFHGRFDFRLPEHLEPGRYDVGFMVIDSESGRVWLRRPPLPSERSINGAAFFNDAVEITTKGGCTMLQMMICSGPWGMREPERVPLHGRPGEKPATTSGATLDGEQTTTATSWTRWLSAASKRPNA